MSGTATKLVCMLLQGTEAGLGHLGPCKLGETEESPLEPYLDSRWLVSRTRQE